jgi:hypothetical protein
LSSRRSSALVLLHSGLYLKYGVVPVGIDQRSNLPVVFAIAQTQTLASDV